jgi:hypothetical protein
MKKVQSTGTVIVGKLFFVLFGTFRYYNSILLIHKIFVCNTVCNAVTP